MEEEGIIMVSEWPPPTEILSDENSEEEISSGSKKRVLEESKDVQHNWKKHKVRNIDVPSVDKILASWYRNNSNDLRIKYRFPVGANPKTLLNFAASTEEGRQMLTSRAESLKNQVGVTDRDLAFYHTLAGLLDKLGDATTALDMVTRGLKKNGIDPENLLKGNVGIGEYLKEIKGMTCEQREAVWLSAKLREDLALKTVGEVEVGVGLIEVERRDYNLVTVQQFEEEFCQARRPVVFFNVPRPTRNVWSLQFIKEQAGHCKFEAKIPVTGSTEWAGLEVSGSKTMAEFLENDTDCSDYLFYWSLPLHAPNLNNDFTVPHLMQDNYLKLTSADALYHQSWPSLFIAKAGISSGLHIDAFSSNFWMFLVSGHKRWTFYKAEDAGRLNPVFYDSLDPVFRPDREQVEGVASYTVDLTAGELLFVPSGSPHRVDNLEDSVAVSGNFVNGTNVGEAMKHFRINALLDPRSEDLLRELLDLKICK